MNFRLIFEAVGPGRHHYGSDRHASAEWRHLVVFEAACHDDKAELSAGFAKGGAFDGVKAQLTLVIEPQQSERVLPRVVVYPADVGTRQKLVEAFVHVPPSFAASLRPGERVAAKLGFDCDWEELFDFTGGDRLGAPCSKVDGRNVIVDTGGA